MNKQSGFTLIEIVMVLVLLGILSAVAVPKYFDLQKQAEEKAAAAVCAEYQATLNGKFAKEVLGGNDCASARKEALKEADALKITGEGFVITKLGEDHAGGNVQLTITPTSGNTLTTKFEVAVPYCGDEGKSATSGS